MGALPPLYQSLTPHPLRERGFKVLGFSCGTFYGPIICHFDSCSIKSHEIWDSPDPLSLPTLDTALERQRSRPLPAVAKLHC